jgi:hypothetical protein
LLEKDQFYERAALSRNKAAILSRGSKPAPGDTHLLVREYLTALPDESVLAAELENTRRQIEARR